MKEENTCKHISELLCEMVESLASQLDNETKKKLSQQLEALKDGRNVGCLENTENSLDSQ